MNTTKAREQQALLPAQEYQESALPPKHWLRGYGASRRLGSGHETSTAGYQGIRACPLSYSDSFGPNKRPDRSGARTSRLVDESCSTRLHMDIELLKPAATISTRGASGGNLIRDGPSTRRHPEFDRPIPDRHCKMATRTRHERQAVPSC